MCRFLVKCRLVVLNLLPSGLKILLTHLRLSLAPSVMSSLLLASVVLALLLVQVVCVFLGSLRRWQVVLETRESRT